ncbi:MAG: hypothetical protein ACJ78D_13855 [Gemmatimonadaceae bacterium]
MFRLRVVRSVGVVLGALLIASCSDVPVSNPTAPIDAATSSGTGELGSLTGAVSDATNLELRAVWWERDHKNVSVSQTIGNAGGTISIPETGLTVEFPAGAVASPIAITITADEDYVAYKMEPSGTQFLKDVTVTQSLRTTSIFGESLRSQLYAAYIADDGIKLSGKVPVLEIEPSHTIFSTLKPLLPIAHVWVIRHFSRYMLASG